MSESNANPSTSVGSTRMVGARPIYEMVDATDYEQYYPLGLWLDLNDAIKAVEVIDDPTDLGSDGHIEEYAKVEIRERKNGWCGHGQKVYVREWVGDYPDDDSDMVWRVTPTA